jgi:hypothetical protein
MMMMTILLPLVSFFSRYAQALLSSLRVKIIAPTENLA